MSLSVKIVIIVFWNSHLFKAKKLTLLPFFLYNQSVLERSFNMKYKKIVAWILFLFWVVLIFYFSSQTGSESSNLSKNIIENIFHGISIDKIIFLISLLRKLAHFSEYFILSFLLVHLILQYKKIGAKEITLVMFFCFLYASSDEFHQSFVPHRGPSFLDVLLDYSGSLLFILFYNFFQTLKLERDC